MKKPPEHHDQLTPRDCVGMTENPVWSTSVYIRGTSIHPSSICFLLHSGFVQDKHYCHWAKAGYSDKSPVQHSSYFNLHAWFWTVREAGELGENPTQTQRKHAISTQNRLWRLNNFATVGRDINPPPKKKDNFQFRFIPPKSRWPIHGCCVSHVMFQMQCCILKGFFSLGLQRHPQLLSPQVPALLICRASLQAEVQSPLPSVYQGCLVFRLCRIQSKESFDYTVF